LIEELTAIRAAMLAASCRLPKTVHDDFRSEPGHLSRRKYDQGSILLEVMPEVDQIAPLGHASHGGHWQEYRMQRLQGTENSLATTFTSGPIWRTRCSNARPSSDPMG
jgi:hypothetical protein